LTYELRRGRVTEKKGRRGKTGILQTVLRKNGSEATVNSARDKEKGGSPTA